MLFAKQSFNKSIILIITLTLIAACFLVNEILMVQTRIETDSHTTQTLKSYDQLNKPVVSIKTAKSEPEKKNYQVKPVENHQQQQVSQVEPIFSEPVMQVNYVENTEDIDTDWQEEDEDQIIEKKRMLYESMTEEEIEIKKQIDTYESQIMADGNDNALSVEIEISLMTLFEPENETENNPVVDIQCDEQLCRLALNVLDEAAQDDAIERILEQFETVEHQATNVTVRDDDSRLVTVYLKRDSQS